MVQYATKDELEILKEQMQVLKNHLAQSDIISQKMLEVTFRHRIKENTNTQKSNLAGVGAGLFIIASFLYSGFVNGTFSIWFTLVSIVWGLICTGVSYHHYHQNTRDVLLNTPLTQSVEAILKWKKQVRTDGLIITLGIAVWLPCCLLEIWGDISQNIDHAVFVFVIIVMSISLSIGHYRKVNTAINELMDQIQELKR